LQRKKDLQVYWQEVIKEHEKENLTPATSCSKKVIKTLNKDSSNSSQPDHYNHYKNIKLNLLFCCDILNELKNKPYAYPFYKCVNAKNLLEIPDYYPMDLSLINLKLKNNQYINAEEFEKDVRLIFHNCCTYNNIKSEIYHMGKALESTFNKQWTEKQAAEKKRKLEIATNDANMDNSFAGKLYFLSNYMITLPHIY